MSQDLEEISGLLKSIREDNASSNNVFGVLLNAISTKLDSLAEDDAVLDLVKVYLTDVKSVLKDEHNFTDSRFKQLENVMLAFENRLERESDYEGAVTKSDILNFITDIKEEFSALDGKIADIYNTFNPSEGVKELQELIAQLKDKFQDDKKPEMTVVEKNIRLLSDNLINHLTEYEHSVDKNINEIKSYLSENNLQTSLFESLSESQMRSEEKLTEKLRNLERTTQGFGASLYDMNRDIKSIIENVNPSGGSDSETDSIKKELEHISSAADTLLSSLNAGLKEIQEGITQGATGDNTAVVSALNEVHEKITAAIDDYIRNNELDAGFIDQNLNEINNKLSAFEIDFKLIAGENAQKIIDRLENINPGTGFNVNISELKSVTSELTDYKAYINGIIESLRGYVDDITFAVRKQASTSGADVSKLELSLEQNHAESVRKLNNLEEKLNNYIVALTKTNLEADTRIANSVDEIKSIKQELTEVLKSVENLDTGLNEKLTAVIKDMSSPSGIDLSAIEEKLDSFLQDFVSVRSSQSSHKELYDKLEDKFNEYVLLLKKTSNEADIKLNGSIAEIKNLKMELADIFEAVEAINVNLGGKLVEIINSIPALSTAKPEEVNTDLKLITEKIDNFLSEVAQNRAQYGSNAYLYESLEEKICRITQEVCLVNTDLAEVLENKYKKIYEEFEPLKSDIKSFFDTGFNGIVSELKTIIISGFSEDIIDELRVQIRNIFDNAPSMSIEPITEAIEDLKDYVQTSHQDLKSRLDVIAMSEDGESMNELNGRFDELVSNDHELSEVLRVIQGKIDLLMLNEDEDLAKQITDVKKLITEQKRQLSELLTKEKVSDLEQRLDNVGSYGDLSNVKESIITSLAAVFEQISFVEESEEIKDFLEEKTGEINQSLLKVNDRLKKITSADDDEYSYTLQDVESDIAKLRMLLNEIDTEGSIQNLSKNITGIYSSIEALSSSLTQEQLAVLKESFEKINEDIMSISTRTNKLLMNSDESGQMLDKTLKQFNNVISNLETKISRVLNDRIEKKLDKIKAMSDEQLETDRSVHKVLTYIGEWVDSISEKLNEVAHKTSGIYEIQDLIKQLRASSPAGLLNELEEIYEKQQNRMDRLEMRLEQVLAALEEIGNDSRTVKKLDKFEKQIAQLTSNIEKLTSYVD